MPSLTGKVAIVTGAGRGIGRAICLELAKEGAAVGLAAKSKDEIDTVAREITAAGGRALAIPTDVGDPASVQRLFQAVESQLGPVDILVNNAGIRGPVGFLQNVAPDQFMDVFRVNVGGTFNCLRLALPGMIQRRWGRIINFSGGGAWTGIRGGGPYGASKSAVEGLTRTIAQEGQRFNITGNAIQPGRVDTKTFPLVEPQYREGRGDTVGPEPAARCIAWLCTEEAADVTGMTISAPQWDRLRGEGLSARVAADKAGATAQRARAE